MRYVFPSFAEADRAGRCASKPSDLVSPGKTDSWQCVTPTPQGTIDVVYGAWSTWDAAHTHYVEKYADPGSKEGDFLTFGPGAVGNDLGDVQGARILKSSYGFSVTVIARSAADVDAGMATVRSRPLASIPR